MKKTLSFFYVPSAVPPAWKIILEKRGGGRGRRNIFLLFLLLLFRSRRFILGCAPSIISRGLYEDNAFLLPQLSLHEKSFRAAQAIKPPFSSLHPISSQCPFPIIRSLYYIRESRTVTRPTSERTALLPEWEERPQAPLLLSPPMIITTRLWRRRRRKGRDGGGEGRDKGCELIKILP